MAPGTLRANYTFKSPLFIASHTVEIRKLLPKIKNVAYHPTFLLIVISIKATRAMREHCLHLTPYSHKSPHANVYLDQISERDC